MNELRNTFFFFWAKKNTKKKFWRKISPPNQEESRTKHTHTSEKDTEIRFLHALQRLSSQYTHNTDSPFFVLKAALLREQQRLEKRFLKNRKKVAFRLNS
jgi:hypothetical protein